MIKAIAFDFRDTLLKVEHGYKAMNELIWKFVVSKDIKISRTDFFDLNQTVIKEEKNKVAKNTKLHDAAPFFIRGIFRKLGLTVSKRDLDKLLDQRNVKFASKVSLYPDAKKLLQKTKKLKLKTAVVIDGNSRRERLIIKRLKLKQYLNVIVISQEVGFNKFTAKPLAAAIKGLRVKPSEILVIGDRVDKDIVHANTLGCVSVRLVRHGGRYASLVGTKTKQKPDYTISSLSKVSKLLT